MCVVYRNFSFTYSGGYRGAGALVDEARIRFPEEEEEVSGVP